MLYMVLIFGGLLPALCALIRHWRKSHVKVNCWFCGLNNIVLKKCHDGWICKHCEQYNGFKPDGDYNRDIPAQWDSTLNGHLSFCSSPQPRSNLPTNGLCQECNRNQELKIAQLASFEPINPENFDHEIENFRYHLERAYRLCPPCDAVLEETLSSKKTHVLDMNLQRTGNNIHNRNHSISKQIFRRSVVQTTAYFTISVALALGAYRLSTISSEHIVFKFSELISSKKNFSSISTSPFVSPFAYLLPGPAVCPKQEVNSNPTSSRILSDLIDENTNAYLEVIGSYSASLCFTGFAFQVVSSWYSGHRFPLLLWTAFVGTEFLQQVLVGADWIQISQVAQIMIALLILIFSWQMFVTPRSQSPSPVKRAALGTSPKLNKWNTENVHRAAPAYANIRKNELKNSIGPSLLKTHSLGMAIQENSNYLTLPARSSSASSLHPSLSTTLSHNAVLSPPVDVQNAVTQEDARSDASVDSAFSNPDSITLDAADSLNSSYSLMGKKSDAQDDVNSLIETLSIGSFSCRQSVKKPSEFRMKSYGRDLKRNSVLSPSRLSNIMNESVNSGIWRNSRNHTTSETRSNVTLTSASEIADVTHQTLSRPSSPSESVHSQATVQTAGTARGFSPPSSFQPVARVWNSPPSPQSTLSVCVPPNPLASNSAFGSVASPIPNPNSHMSQVIYTPYGLYHQMVSPFGNAPVFMMPPQSPMFGNRSPASSFGSQFSPRSFSTSSRFCDSDHDLDFTPKSSKRRPNSHGPFSSSFLESVWQSRFPIMYTTLCYLLLGTMVCAVSYSGIFNVVAEVFSWKQNIVSSVS